MLQFFKDKHTTFLGIVMLLFMTSCQAPVWLYLRNQSNSSLVIEMELLSGARFAHLAQDTSNHLNLAHQITLPLSYEDKILKIKRNTHKKLSKRLQAEVIQENRIRFYLPAHSTLYLAEPYEAVSYDNLRLRYAKANPSLTVYQYQNLPIYLFKRGKGSAFSGYSVYYDIK